MPRFLVSDMPFPFRAQPAMSGADTATGVSQAFEFREAFLNAVERLPALDGGADYLDSVHVMSVRGEFGGIAGIRQLAVTVARVRLTAEQQGEAAHVAEIVGRPDRDPGWKAWHNRMPGTSPTLHVYGELWFPTSGYRAALRRSVPQGINPQYLLLDLVVTPPCGIVLDVLTKGTLHYVEETAQVYTNVTILPEGTDVPVETVW